MILVQMPQTRIRIPNRVIRNAMESVETRTTGVVGFVQTRVLMDSFAIAKLVCLATPMSTVAKTEFLVSTALRSVPIPPA